MGRRRTGGVAGHHATATSIVVVIVTLAGCSGAQVQAARHRAAPGPATTSARQVAGPRSYLYVVPPSGGRARPLLPAAEASRLEDVADPAWSPAGRWIAFTAGCPVCTPRLYVVSASGRHLRQIPTGPGAVHSPTWSPDGRAIAFARQRGDQEFIVAVNLRNDRVRVINGEPESADNSDTTPAWSPDGRQIVFAREIHHEDVTLWLVQATGGSPRPLIARGRAFDQSRPQWSPDGRRVVFMQAVAPSVTWDLYIYEPAARKLSRLTDDPHNEFDPAWSPDGRQVAFDSDAASRAGFRSLYLIGTDGAGLRRLTYGPADDSMPAWSPDGKTLVFVRRPTMPA